MCATKNSDIKDHLSLQERYGKRLHRTAGPADSSGFFSRKRGNKSAAPHVAASALKTATGRVQSAELSSGNNLATNQTSAAVLSVQE